MKKRKLIPYEDAAAKMAAKAKKTLFEGIAREWEAARGAADKAGKLEIEAVNRLRQVGMKLQEVTGREQVHLEFWHDLSEKLPKELTFKAAKFCVHLARNVTEPVKTLDEARRTRQLMFEAFGMADAPKRLEAQTQHDRNVWSDFVAGAASFSSLFTKLEREAPMLEWGKDKLEKFVNETTPIVEKHRMATVILSGKDPAVVQHAAE